MKVIAALLTALALSVALAAQETKPVPKDSVRVFVPGCSKGAMFTAGRRTEDQPGGSAVPEGTRLRMNGPKKLMSEIKAQEGARIEITGLIKRASTSRAASASDQACGSAAARPAAVPAGWGRIRSSTRS